MQHIQSRIVRGRIGVPVEDIADEMVSKFEMKVRRHNSGKRH
jgi:hypothetical protein